MIAILSKIALALFIVSTGALIFGLSFNYWAKRLYAKERFSDSAMGKEYTARQYLRWAVDLAIVAYVLQVFLWLI